MLGADIDSDKLVEDFGVFSPSHQVFSEEYISGETVHQYLTRKKNEIASNDFKDRWQMRWLHYIWNGAAAYLEFWKRSGESDSGYSGRPIVIISFVKPAKNDPY